MFSRDTITAVHSEGIGQIAEGIEPLDTEGSIKSTLNQVEFGYCIHNGCGTTWEEHTIATTDRLSILNFEATHVHRDRRSGVAITRFHTTILQHQGAYVKHYRNSLIYKGFPRAFGGFPETVWTVFQSWQWCTQHRATLEKNLDSPLDNW